MGGVILKRELGFCGRSKVLEKWDTTQCSTIR